VCIAERAQFVAKFKQLALTQPLVGFSALPRSHKEAMRLLNQSTNSALQKMVEELHKTLQF
jgi:hypothetical protein